MIGSRLPRLAHVADYHSRTSSCAPSRHDRIGRPPDPLGRDALLQTAVHRRMAERAGCGSTTSALWRPGLLASALHILT